MRINVALLREVIETAEHNGNEWIDVNIVGDQVRMMPIAPEQGFGVSLIDRIAAQWGKENITHHPHPGGQRWKDCYHVNVEDELVFSVIPGYGEVWAWPVTDEHNALTDGPVRHDDDGVIDYIENTLHEWVNR